MFRLSLLFFLSGLTSIVAGQGSWRPAGADTTFPRTLMDPGQIENVREYLLQPETGRLYQSVWGNATGLIPAGNVADIDRINRSIIAREAVFCLLLDRKYDNGIVAPLLQEEQDSILTRSLRLLREMNTAVGFQEGWVFYQEWQHRSKELINYLITWDLLKGAGLADSLLATGHDSLVSFTANLYQRAMAEYTVFIFKFRFFEFQFNNHSLMTASALGLAAVVLGDHSDPDPGRQPVSWINAGLWNVDNTLWVENGIYPRVSEPDTLAGYAEGPGYFEYAFQNVFPFLRGLCNYLPDVSLEVTFRGVVRQVPHPWYDTRYDRLYDWLNRIRMPDGSLPAIHDSPVDFRTTITALSGKPAFNLPFPGFSYDYPFIRTQYIATMPAQGTIADSLFQPLPAAGSMVFRSGWDTGAIYLHCIGKHGIALTGAKSHHQGDATSFSLMAFGQLLAIDPGYPGAPQSDATNKPEDHNVLLVGNAGPEPPTGEFVSSATNTAYIENFFDLPGLDYGEIRGHWGGTDVIRKVLFIRNRYFILNDGTTTATGGDFNLRFHGNGLLGSSASSGEGSFQPDFEQQGGTWCRDTICLQVRSINAVSSDLEIDAVTDSMAIGYGLFRRYTVLDYHATGAQVASFLTSLFPYHTEEPEIRLIQSEGPGAAIVAAADGKTDLTGCSPGGAALKIPAGQTGLNGDLFFHGSLGFVGLDETGHPYAFYLADGDTLQYGNQYLVTGTQSLSVAMIYYENGNISGYVSEPSDIRIHTGGMFRVVSGQAAAESWDEATGLLHLAVTEPGYLQLEPATGQENSPENTLPFATLYPNPNTQDRYFVRISSGRPEIIRLTLTDPSGKQIRSWQQQVQSGSGEFIINLSGLPNGRYLLEVRAGKRRALLFPVRER